MKKILMSAFAISSLSLTGCLEEILASLCEDLAEKNSIVTNFVSSTNYDGVAVLTYTNEDASQSLKVSECDGGFSFPSGEKTVVAGESVSFLTVIDEAKESFFFNNGVAKTDDFSVNVAWFDNCEDMNPVDDFSSAPAQLDFQGAIDLPEEVPLPIVNECTLSGETAIVTVSESI